MTLHTGDYVIGVRTADGTRGALGPLVAMANGKYCVPAMAADGKIIAAGLNKLNASGQYGIGALAADGKTCGLTPGGLVCPFCEFPAYATTVVVSGFSGLDVYGADWSTLNGTWVIAGPIVWVSIWNRCLAYENFDPTSPPDPIRYAAVDWVCEDALWQVSLSIKSWVGGVYANTWCYFARTDDGSLTPVGSDYAHTFSSGVDDVTIGTVEVTDFS